MSAMQRRKGEVGMLEVQHMLEGAWPLARKRSQYRGARKDGCDVEGTPYWVEVKFLKDVRFRQVEDWLYHASAESDGRPVAVFFRGNGQRWRVAVWVDRVSGRYLVQNAQAWCDDMARARGRAA